MRDGGGGRGRKLEAWPKGETQKKVYPVAVAVQAEGNLGQTNKK